MDMSGVYTAGCGNSACLGIWAYIDNIQEKKRGVLTTMGLQERGIEALIGPFLCLTEKEKDTISACCIYP